MGLSLPPFYRYENWGSERLRDLPKVTQLEIEELGFEPRQSDSVGLLMLPGGPRMRSLWGGSCFWVGTRRLFPHLSLLGQKPAITPVNSAENSTSTTRPTRSTWPYTPPSVSTFSAWGKGEPTTGWGSGVLPGEGQSLGIQVWPGASCLQGLEKSHP